MGIKGSYPREGSNIVRTGVDVQLCHELSDAPEAYEVHL
jgi:hypothetical protein